MPARVAPAPAPVPLWPKLSPGSQALLTAAVLHGGELSDATLAVLAADPIDVDQLVADGWLAESNAGQWRVTTPAGDVPALAPWSMRRAAHLALARLFERDPLRGAEAASHFESGGQPDTAGRLWLGVARLHCRRHQHQPATHAFGEATRLLPPDTSEAELVAAVRDFGMCAALQRDTTAAAELLQTWREQAAWQGRPFFQGWTARVLADLLARQGRHMESAEQRRDGANHFTRAGDAGEAAAEMLAAATTLVWALRFSAAREVAQDAVNRARQHNRPDLESQALAVLGLTLGMMGEIANGRASLEAALELALSHKLPAQAANAYRLMGNVDDYASRYDDQTSFRKAISYCARHDQPTIADLCRGCLSYSLFRGGRWRQAVKLARQVAEGPGVPEGSRAAGIMVQGMIRIYRGELRPGMALVEEGLLLGRQNGIAAIEIFAWTTLAAAHEMGERPNDAASCYRRLMEFWLTTEDRHDVLPGFCGAVSFFAAQGNREQAAAFAAPLQHIAALTSNPEAIAAADYAAAELKLLDGHAAEAVAAFRQALAVFETHHCSVELIRTRLRLAAALTATGETTQAARMLREARARATRLGCRPLAALAAEALTPGRTSPTAPARTGVLDVLSPRQRDVAGHLKSGRTNKEIATVLGLSVRTVDMHVAHLFARLDCRTRTEAAAKLARQSDN